MAFASLLARFGTARAALDALPTLSRKILKVPPRAAIEDELARDAARGIRWIAACEPDYPPLLAQLDPAPPLISVLGDVSVLARPSVAMVGSRNASALGRKLATQMAYELGQEGYVLVSGLARGIDAAAHRGALQSGTVAVLGGGLDHIYPRENAGLYQDILETGGAIISECAVGYTAKARDFPRRNRIVSGLSLGVVVVEAAERSGTLITARTALEQNREVMACPGHPLDPRAAGCNRLIRDGRAALVSTTEHVLQTLQGPREHFASFASAHSLQEPGADYAPMALDPDTAAPQIADAKQRLRDLAGPAPTPKDDLIRESSLPTALAMAALLEMELDGEVSVGAGGGVGLS